jgi:DNA-directed RNA polymerase subunit omega
MEFLHKKQTEADRMQGISSEAAVNAVGNRYDLVLIASRRARELSRGDQPRLASRRGPVVTALTEIEAGLVKRDYLRKEIDIDAPRRRRPK